ncbi:MAG TPA: hypothetical protein VK607_09005, partial [Kofleriaceae bacterium]|nr:hypothetical protein [Kofleriaceae bacterium]
PGAAAGTAQAAGGGAGAAVARPAAAGARFARAAGLPAARFAAGGFAAGGFAAPAFAALAFIPSVAVVRRAPGLPRRFAVARGFCGVRARAIATTLPCAVRADATRDRAPR